MQPEMPDPHLLGVVDDGQCVLDGFRVGQGRTIDVLRGQVLRLALIAQTTGTGPFLRDASPGPSGGGDGRGLGAPSHLGVETDHRPQ